MSAYLVMMYHSNPFDLYKKEWIEQCSDSIRNQTFQDFDVVELDYSCSGKQVYSGSEFWSIEMPTFVHATNYLLDYARDMGYLGAFNIHLDDFYALDRFEKQIEALLNYDLVSSNFYAVDENNSVLKTYEFDKLDVMTEMNNNHNILCNPVVAFSRRWLEEGVRFDPDLAPVEDFVCWKENRFSMKMTVLPEFLCYHRSHPNEVSNSENR